MKVKSTIELTEDKITEILEAHFKEKYGKDVVEIAFNVTKRLAPLIRPGEEIKIVLTFNDELPTFC